jgi:hypothetical protein
MDIATELIFLLELWSMKQEACSILNLCSDQNNLVTAIELVLKNQ